jgi:hypothetical protein
VGVSLSVVSETPTVRTGAGHDRDRRAIGVPTLFAAVVTEESAHAATVG